MALETATYIDGLVNTNPTSGDPVSAGDDHVRLIKTVLKNTFPNVAAAVTRTAAEMNYPVPIGSVLMWWGLDAEVPDGFGLCDGTTYDRTDGGGDLISPDLRGLFVRGAVNDAGVGVAGGADSVSTSSNGAHTHTVSVASGGAHAHTGSTSTDGAHDHGGSTVAGGNHDHGGSTVAGGNHDHGGSTDSHSLTTAQMPAHRHKMAANVTDDGAGGRVGASQQVAAQNVSGTDEYHLTGTSTEATLGQTAETGGGSGHSHGIGNSGTHTHNIGSSGTHTHNITSGGNHNHSVTIPSGGAHTHTGTAESGGAHQHTVATVPAYRGMHFIIKI
jgi:hypothetical protein